MPFDLPPKLWLPQKPAIVRAATLDDVKVAMPLMGTFAAASVRGLRARASGGGNDANTVLLLHFDGSDASTTITDSSLTTPHTCTANGNAQIDTADSKFGGSSLLLDGTGDSVSWDGTDSDLTWAGDFTIDWWMKSNTQTTEGGAGRRIFSAAAGATGLECLIDSVNGTLEVWNSAAKIIECTTDVVDNTWRHIAIERYSGTMRIYVDGVSEHSAANATTWAGTNPMYIGRYQASGIGHYLGWIDEFRVSNIARYLGTNFTPPTVAYS